MYKSLVLLIKTKKAEPQEGLFVDHLSKYFTNSAQFEIESKDEVKKI